MPGKCQTGSIAALVTRISPLSSAPCRRAAMCRRQEGGRSSGVAIRARFYGDRRTRVDTGADMLAKNLTDEVAPGVERHDLRRVGPIADEPRSAPRAQCGKNPAGDPAPGLESRSPGRDKWRRRRNKSRPRCGAAASTELATTGPRSAGLDAPQTQRDCALTSRSRVGSQPDVARVSNAPCPFALEKQIHRYGNEVITGCSSAACLTMVLIRETHRLRSVP